MRKSLSIISVALLVLSACNRGGSVSLQSGDSMGTQVLEQPMPRDGEVNVPGHGKEVWFAYGAIEGTFRAPASGIATAHYLEDGTFVLAIHLNIAVPEEGTFYEGWLSSSETGERTSIGHLANGLGDARHGLRFEGTDDLRSFTELSVTLESDDGNPEASAAVVATALLKKTQR